MNRKHTLRATTLAACLAAAGQAWATNGMLMEGYGPVGLAMGGAAQAYDNGTAAMMNNPATLQLGDNGTRADLALGVLGPHVTSMGEKSGGTSYVMPAFGWVRKNDQLSYGVGVFGQGGMGTEYGANSQLAGGTGQAVRSELGVGRVIVPLAYKVNEQLNVGATLDYAWSGLDLKMAASSQQLGGMYAAAGGDLNQLGPVMSSMGIQGARLDFSNDNKFTGAATSGGFTGKLGLVFKATPTLQLGASYQLKTALSDMKTGTSGATMTFLTANGAMPVMGQMVVRDFQMPSVLAFGAALQATPALMLVADVKRIGWKSVMEKFSMTFNSPTLASYFGASSMNFAMPQNWKDQNVLSLGGAYKVDADWTLRAGYSHSSNPIPDATVHPLFPAIVKNHYTGGFGYRISKTMTFDAAVSHAPKVSVVNSQMGIPISHSQTNYQLMLSTRY